MRKDATLFVDTFQDFQIFATRHLPKPRIERERFSGGVNLTARKRNRDAVEAARKIYVIESERKIIVPDWYAFDFLKELRGKRNRLEHHTRDYFKPSEIDGEVRRP